MRPERDGKRARDVDAAVAALDDARPHAATPLPAGDGRPGGDVRALAATSAPAGVLRRGLRILRRTARHRRRAALRFLLHATLIALGAANVYPFLWMVGTSLKSTGEAGFDRHRPLPQAKYRLADEMPGELPLDISEPALLALAAARRPGAPALLPSAYAHAARLDPEAAVAELDALAAQGWLLPGRGDAPRRLGPAAARIPALSEGQLRCLRALLVADAEIRGKRVVERADRRTVAEYAERYAGGDRALARRELDQLADAGWLVRSLVQTENYAVVWSERRFYLHALNSLAVCATVVFASVLFSAMMGYALARLRFPGKSWVIGLLIVGMVAPHEATTVPIFRMIQSLGLFTGLWGMVLWMIGVGIGNAFLMAGWFMTMPREVEEAARVDGAGTFRTFFDVALPMARPIVATVALMSFLGAWNNFMVPLLGSIADASLQPLSVAVYTFQQARAGFWELTNAAAVIMVAPVIVLFVLLSKHIVRSVAAGAVKG